jgi:hypothetical protein
MRLILLAFSIAFVVYGLLPYNKATNIDTTMPNQLVVNQQECGCPCPEAGIIEGRLNIPQELASKYKNIHTSQLNLDIEDFNEPYNYELGQAKLFIKGKVVGADTILCDPTNCEIAPRFRVDSWRLVETVATAWTFPVWLGLLFLITLFLLMPALIIAEIVKRVRKKEMTKNSS